MDKTEQYIKMCDCPEIQGQYSPKDGDWFVADRQVYVRTDFDPMTNRAHLNEMFIWLPRQDQLQEMIEPIVGYPNNLVVDFWEWFDECNGIDNDIAFTSMEQLWLAFVMKSLHSKVWNGDSWVKEEVNDEGT